MRCAAAETALVAAVAKAGPPVVRVTVRSNVPLGDGVGAAIAEQRVGGFEACFLYLDDAGRQSKPGPGVPAKAGYHQLFPHAGARYISTGGGVGTDAPALIGRAISAMPAPADVVSATDADEGGEKLHRQLEAAGGRLLRRHASPLPKDWNDYLQKTLERSQPHRREHRLER